MKSFNIFKYSSKNLSANNPKMPPGIVAATKYQNILPSFESSFFIAFLYPAINKFIQSLKKKIKLLSL